MWKVEKPPYTAPETFATCVGQIASADLLARMQGIAELVSEAAGTYDERAEQASLHLFAPATAVGEVSAKEMGKLYSGRMVPKTSAGRGIYNAILALAKHGRCPYCGHRTVSTLDHLLAKARYPIFAVTPNNLAPSCTDCNKAKRDEGCATPGEQYLHPYFDEVEEDLWLAAEILETQPASARFFVQAHDDWSELTTQRVEHQFQTLGLNALYVSQAADELSGLQHQLRNLFERAGAAGVRASLKETYESRSKSRTNSWQSALYAALGGSDWYCQGGFA